MVQIKQEFQRQFGTSLDAMIEVCHLIHTISSPIFATYNFCNPSSLSVLTAIFVQLDRR